MRRWQARTTRVVIELASLMSLAIANGASVRRECVTGVWSF